MRRVSAFAFLSPDDHMIVVQADGFDRPGGYILAAQSIVHTHEEQAPTGAGLNLDERAQQTPGHGLSHDRSLPGNDAEEIGPGIFVGMRQMQEAGECSQGLVLGGTDQQGFNEIQGMPLLSGRKVHEQRNQKVAQAFRMRDNPGWHRSSP